MPGHSSGDLVAFHHGVLDDAREVGERVMHHGHPVHDSVAPRSLSRHRIVVNDVFCDQAIQRVLISGGDRADDRFVGLSQTPLAHPHMVLPVARSPPAARRNLGGMAVSCAPPPSRCAPQGRATPRWRPCCPLQARVQGARRNRTAGSRRAPGGPALVIGALDGLFLPPGVGALPGRIAEQHEMGRLAFAGAVTAGFLLLAAHSSWGSVWAGMLVGGFGLGVSNHPRAGSTLHSSLDSGGGLGHRSEMNELWWDTPRID